MDALQIMVTISLMVSISTMLALWQSRPDTKMRSILAVFVDTPPSPEKIFGIFNRARFQVLLRSAGVKTTPERYILFKFLLSGMMAWNLRNSVLMFIIVPAIFFLPDIFLARQKKARQIKLLIQMPGCLDIISALIASGMDIGQAIAQVPAVLKEPLRSEMLQAGAEYNLTRDLQRALGNVASRTGMLEFEHLMMALAQAEASGRVRGVLKKQSDLLRKRLHFANVQGTSGQSLMLTMSMAVLFLNAVLLLGGPIFFSVLSNLEAFFG